MKSIQSKILTVVIAGLLIITAVVSAIAVNMTHEIMHTDADRILKNATQKEAAYLNDVLGDVVKSSSVMEHYATTEITNVNQLRDKEFLANYLQKGEVMFTEVALNTQGIEGFYLRISPTYTDGTTGFYKMITADKKLLDMKLTDILKYDKNDTQNVGWYYSSINEKNGMWLDPYYFPGNQNELISFVHPLYVNDTFFGIVGFDMNFGYFVEHINNISVYDHGCAVLLAKDGKTVYNDIPEDEEETDTHKHNHNPLTKSKVELKNGMFLELRAEYKDIQRDIRPMMTKIVIAFVAVLFVAIVYTVFVTHRIVKPLKRLTAAAESISEGVTQTDVTNIPVESKDEIGTLSRVLSTAYAKIQEYTTYINALAYRDSLTGIKNSTAYAEAIEELNKEINHGNPQFGVLVADINNLKQTNDQHGHDIGNNLINHTAKILTETFKTSAVFRIGGDEFAVILQNGDYAEYHTLITKFDEACAKDFITVSAHRVPVSVARGVALYDQSIDCIYEDVFSKADHAMYLNKEESKAALL